MNSLWSKSFWADAVERAVKSLSQAALAFLTTETIFDVRTWQTIALIGLFSIMMSIAGKNVGDPDTASLVPGSFKDSNSFAKAVADAVAERVTAANSSVNDEHNIEVSETPRPVLKENLSLIDSTLSEYQSKTWGSGRAI